MRRVASGLALIVLCVAAAHADDPATPPAEAPAYDMGAYCAGQSTRTRYMPERALTRRISGRVVLDCVVDDERRLISCLVIEETPPETGFAASALSIACRFSPNPNAAPLPDGYTRIYTAEDGRSRVRMPFEFRNP
jgi:TonB family protein